MARFTAFLLASALPAAAFAHAGAHDAGFLNTLLHLLREPDHLLATLAAVVVGIATIVAVARLRKTR